MSNFHTVDSVEPLSSFKLLVTFSDGQRKEYDVEPLIDINDIFAELKLNKQLFKRVKVDAGGYGISWNKNIDLSCEELYTNGRIILS